MSTEVQQGSKRNRQARSSLLLGLASILLVLFNLAPPGLWAILAFTGVGAALLAFIAGARGIQAGKKLGGQGRKEAIFGIAAGGLGLLLYFLTWNISVEKLGEDLLSTSTPGIAQTFKGDGFSISFSADWEEWDEFFDRDYCQGPVFECLLSIDRLNSEGTFINFFRYPLADEITVEEFDQNEWSLISQNDVTLLSKGTLEVDGIPAIKRIYLLQAPDDPDMQFNILQVYAVRELYSYYVFCRAPDAETMAQHQQEFEEIIASIQFFE